MRQDTKVYLDLESEQKLSEFGITRTEAMKVVQRIVAARADAVDDDPLGTAGQFAHIFGTRHIRALLKRVGWVNHREENVESVFHEATKRKIIYKSVDIAGVVAHSPQSSRDIGPGARRLVNAAQGMLFPESELPEQVSTISGDPPCVWYFCVSVDHMPETGDRIVGAELSQPYPFDGDNFGPFIERVIIRKNGPWDGVLIEEDDMADDHAAEFEPAISRK